MMTEKNKMECDDLLKTHEMTQKLLDANTADAAMLATLVQMARGGKDEMALYVLHNIKPHALKLAEEPEEEEDEPGIDLDLGDLLRFLRS